jgi:uncharacterized protein YjiS (DUF1127 family)
MSATLKAASARFPLLAWHAATILCGPLATLREWHWQNRARQLHGLSDHMLRDIGLSRPEVDSPSRLMDAG